MPSPREPDSPASSLRPRVLVPYHGQAARRSGGWRAVKVSSLLLLAMALTAVVALLAGVHWADLSQKLRGL